jgi:hypothetical protein
MTAVKKLAWDAFVLGCNQEAERAKWAAGLAAPVLREAIFEEWWAKRMVFRHGAAVRLKKPKRGQTRSIGYIRNRPGPNARTVYVVWPNGWAGHCKLDELIVVLDDKGVA